jgi:LAO/AO transport system kinase
MRSDIASYIEGICNRDRAILGRAITLVESDRPDDRSKAQELLHAVLPRTGNAHRIGISGVPGVGKSTFIDRFGCQLVDDGHRVAVLAVDPSSSLTRGSILGDKTRMELLGQSDDAFIRPSPTGGATGGVGRKTRESILVCEAAGYDVILVETVGVGQSETLVADMVDVFLVLMLTGAGDELQGIKRGILELADIIAVNKADGANLEPALAARAELASALNLFRPPRHEPWHPRVVTCSAALGTGLEEIWDLILEHHRTLHQSGELQQRRSRQQLRWMWSLVDEAMMAAVRENPTVANGLEQLKADVLDGRTTATAAADTIVAAMKLDR